MEDKNKPIIKEMTKTTVDSSKDHFADEKKNNHYINDSYFTDFSEEYNAVKDNITNILKRFRSNID